MSHRLKEEFKILNDSVIDYAKSLTELEKARFLEKISLIGAYIFRLFVTGFFLLLVMAFLLSAVAVWSGRLINSYLGGVFIAGGVLILLTAAGIIFRKQIVTGSVIRNLSKILFNDEEK